MGFSARALRNPDRRPRLRHFLLALAGCLGVANGAQALNTVPGPPLPADFVPPSGAYCPAPAEAGPWRAAGFGVAALAIGWAARRRD